MTMDKYGPIQELCGKTVERITADGGVLRVEFTDRSAYEFQSSYSHSLVYVERIECAADHASQQS